jgi:hypothetical protein
VNHYSAAKFLHVSFGFRVIRITRHKFNLGWISVEKYMVALSYFLAGPVLQD